jgi:hypothetical protein
MSHTASGHYRKQKWYNKNVFPLIPVIDIKKSNEHNTSGFSFRWLIFTFWSLDSFAFEVAFVSTTHWGIGFNGIFPYLRWVIAIPCPEKLGIWIDRKLGRRTQEDTGGKII